MEKYDIYEEIKVEEVNLEDADIMEDSIQPGGAVCGLGCIGAGVHCGIICPK